jgi:hypothetical protein
VRQTTYRTNKALRALLEQALRRDRVGQRKKSQWICRAISQLIENDPTLNSVGAGEDLESFTDIETIIFDDQTEALLERAFRIIRSIDPQAEGIQASLIRAAIRYSAK